MTSLTPSMGRIVIVRNESGDAPGIINAVNRDGTVSVQLFPARSTPYCTDNLSEIDHDPGRLTGWFWPPRQVF